MTESMLIIQGGAYCFGIELDHRGRAIRWAPKAKKSIILVGCDGKDLFEYWRSKGARVLWLSARQLRELLDISRKLG